MAAVPTVHGHYMVQDHGRRRRYTGRHETMTASARCWAATGESLVIEAVILDVDGTLVDSVDLHAKAWQDAFRDYGHEIPFAAIREQIGKGGDQLMPVFLSRQEMETEAEALEKHRSQILKERYLDKVRAFPAVRQLLRRLRDDGVRIVLASSAKADELEVYKKLIGSEGLLDAETSSDDAEKSKPHPDIFKSALAKLGGIDPSNIVVVGDTPYDAQAAAKLGLRTIGMLCGGFPEDSLRQAGCFSIYLDPVDLLARYEDSPIVRRTPIS